jgi:hypothetical protein
MKKLLILKYPGPVWDYSGKSNTELLTAFLQTTTPDILAISEHGLKDDEITQCTLEGCYTVVSQFSRKEHEGRGTAIYRSKNVLQIKPMKWITEKVYKTSEVTGVQLARVK